MADEQWVQKAKDRLNRALGRLAESESSKKALEKKLINEFNIDVSKVDAKEVEKQIELELDSLEAELEMLETKLRQQMAKYSELL